MGALPEGVPEARLGREEGVSGAGVGSSRVPISWGRPPPKHWSHPLVSPLSSVTRDQALAGLRAQGLIPRPEMAPPTLQTAPPSPATPSPRARQQAQDPRARVAAAAGRDSRSAATVLGPRCGLSNSRHCGTKAQTKGRGALPAP